jgi:hypothetical protein
MLGERTSSSGLREFVAKSSDTSSRPGGVESYGFCKSGAAFESRARKSRPSAVRGSPLPLYDASGLRCAQRELTTRKARQGQANAKESNERYFGRDRDRRMQRKAMSVTSQLRFVTTCTPSRLLQSS